MGSIDKKANHSNIFQG